MATMDDLVRQVQDLEGATTDLLDATNVSKKTLDEAVDSAKGSAGSASTDADTASSKAGESVTARNEAVKAKDDAKAIVYESEATLTPTPGSIPIADSNAKIDNDWLPFGEVNNPYSGVIGSVDKTDLFSFNQSSTAYSNRFDFRFITSDETKKFNIGGRFVELTYPTGIVLPEAESTADRAIAFDDVFLDWNGNIDNYRSITPHRTNTGYDADEIASEHGYSKVSNGLYKTGDTYALLLCRIARRNQGAYHPVWNPEGSGSFGRRSYGYTRWWNIAWEQEITTENCFNLDSSTEEWIQGGDIQSGATTNPNALGSGRPYGDSAFYDAIYADDVTPLYFSAERVIDRQALLFDSFNKAVAGETFSGAEGTSTGFKVKFISENSGPQGYGILTYDPLVIAARTQEELRSVYVKGIEYVLSNASSSAFTTIYVTKSQFEANPFEVGDVMYVENTRSINFAGYPTQLSARPQFLAVDIIGSLDEMPQEWLDNGLPGNWLAVGEEGENLIPDGTSKNFKLSRKCLECYLVLRSYDRGNNWSDITSSWAVDFQGAGNSRVASIISTECVMIFYRTAANPFELAGRHQLYAIGNKAHIGNFAKENHGSLLGLNLIGKVMTEVTYSDNRVNVDYSLVPLGSSNASFTQYGEPSHTDTIRSMTLYSNRAFKALPFFQRLASGYVLQLMYKEMKHDGTQWGDDNKFNVVYNQSTTTDLNGETVIVGQKRTALPYHFDGVTL